ncbi:acyl-CoA thioesterase [Fertoebacter nigrum]|uniref:Acyl-CoA thioesterase n=1 Tax=Fertoeibacter niger TaxID=2656921 RepID=A0A8X8H781_9RHOB|nr:thioesterase family protein [Fertoeibacter niger]NUB44581.1 acyl-CoA thioesterase [Fertoeibacter niger]
MSYTRIIPIEFNHCDPAGIVFYPRYFEMTNSVMENFFADVLRYPYARITVEEHCSVPTVRLVCDFKAPSRLGERVEFTLEQTRIGGASANFTITARAGAELRLTVELILVWVNAQGRAEAWPAVIRNRMTAFMEGNPQ